MKRFLKVKGISNLEVKPTGFTGKIEFEQRKNGIYFIWRLHNDQGEFLGERELLVSNNYIIPAEKDSFDSALSFAMKSINNYRRSRRKVFKVIESHWED
jgi:hypothetical protein